jgi:hypothetical protein
MLQETYVRVVSETGMQVIMLKTNEIDTTENRAFQSNSSLRI